MSQATVESCYRVYFYPEMGHQREFFSGHREWMINANVDLLPLCIPIQLEYAQAFLAVKSWLSLDQQLDWLEALWDAHAYAQIPQGSTTRAEGIVNLAHLSTGLDVDAAKTRAADALAQVAEIQQNFERLGLEEVPVVIQQQAKLVQVLAYADTQLDAL